MPTPIQVAACSSLDSVLSGKSNVVKKVKKNVVAATPEKSEKGKVKKMQKVEEKGNVAIKKKKKKVAA